MTSASRRDQKHLVLTIDPARRLATALGLDIEGNDAVSVPIGNGSKSNLYAAMLDPGPAWDAMVKREASADIAERILDNRVYRQIADTFVHGNDYAALGWLDDAISSGRYSLILIDTPPSQNAFDFFDAPTRVADFFGSPLLGWLTGGDGAIVAGAAAKTFATVADRLLGAEFFADVAEFFQLMSSVMPAMVERTSSVAADLAGEDAAFVAVTSPTHDVGERLDQLAAALAERGLTFDGVVVNGVEPVVFNEAKVLDVAQRVATNTKSPLSAKQTSTLRPGADYVVERCEVAALQRKVLAELPAQTVATIPRMVHSPSDIDGLLAIGELLWNDPAG